MFFNKDKSILIYFTLIFACLLSTFILWLPFILRVPSWFGINIDLNNFLYIYKNYDGILYIIPAKTLYNPNLIQEISQSLMKPLYFAAHLPLYPVFIRLFSYIFGYLKSMIFVNVLFTCILACFFYFFVKKLKISEKPIVLTIVFLFLPRFLIVRSVGAPESLFILLILSSLFFFEKKKYLISCILAGLSAMTKTPGILLFIVYIFVFIEEYLNKKKVNWNFLFTIFVPIGILLVFLLYFFQYGDFFAYFHTGGIVPMSFPFSVFNHGLKWVGTVWLEDIIFYFFIYALTVVTLKRSKYRSFFYFSLVFLTASILVQHRDIARYTLPIWPIAIIAFEKFFTSRKFLAVFIILLPAIYMYAWNFMTQNYMPIADWTPFL